MRHVVTLRVLGPAVLIEQCGHLRHRQDEAVVPDALDGAKGQDLGLEIDAERDAHPCMHRCLDVVGHLHELRMRALVPTQAAVEHNR